MTKKVLVCMKSSPNGAWKRAAYWIHSSGQAGVGPWFNHGPATWLTPFDPSRDRSDEDRVLDASDLNALLAEIEQHGSNHIRWFLIDSGLATLVSSKKFNKCSHLVSTIDIQFDSGGLSYGVRREYDCPILGLSWTSEFSH